MIIVADVRETASELPRLLEEMGVGVRYEQLAVGDYVLPGDIAIERKAVHDFISSIFDGRLFRQVSELADHYSRAILLVEGDISMVNELVNNVKVYYGALASLVLKFSARLVFVPSVRDSAIFIERLISNLNKEEQAPAIVRRKGESVAEQQVTFISSLPGIGPTLATRLLERFGSPLGVLTAPRQALAEVVGEKKAERIKRFLEGKYSEEKRKEEGQSRLL